MMWHSNKCKPSSVCLYMNLGGVIFFAFSKRILFIIHYVNKVRHDIRKYIIISKSTPQRQKVRHTINNYLIMSKMTHRTDTHTRADKDTRRCEHGHRHEHAGTPTLSPPPTSPSNHIFFTSRIVQSNGTTVLILGKKRVISNVHSVSNTKSMVY